MSKIQDAIKKHRKGKVPANQGFSLSQDDNPTVNGEQRSVVPIARKKAISTGGVRRHINQADLVTSGLLAPLDSAIPVADEFRRIKRPLVDNAAKGTACADDHLNIIMVASALPASGKTFCSVNLAVSVSLERELNVLLVDADVAKPQISREFGLSDRPGLTDLLESDSRGIDEVLVRTDLNEIQVLPAGRKHSQSTELLASDRMKKVVDELATRYSDRIIIMDSPPLLITSEAQALAQQVGQIVLVVESGKTTHQELTDSLSLLDPGKAINVILNKSTFTTRGGYYGGGYGHYGFNDEK